MRRTDGPVRPTAARWTQPSAPTAPRYKLAVITWMAVYPTITLVLAAMQSLGLGDLALPFRTLLATLLLCLLLSTDSHRRSCGY